MFMPAEGRLRESFSGPAGGAARGGFFLAKAGSCSRSGLG